MVFDITVSKVRELRITALVLIFLGYVFTLFLLIMVCIGCCAFFVYKSWNEQDACSSNTTESSEVTKKRREKIEKFQAKHPIFVRTLDAINTGISPQVTGKKKVSAQSSSTEQQQSHGQKLLSVPSSQQT